MADRDELLKRLSEMNNGGRKNRLVAVGWMPWVFGLLLFLPFIVLGWAVVGQIIKFMNSPIIGGTVPGWVVLVGVVILYYILKR